MDKKVPEVRFKRFGREWENLTLGDLGSVTMNKRIFKHQTTITGDVPFFKIGTFGKQPDAFISKALFNEYKAKYPYPVAGDLLLSASGSIGRVVEYKGEEHYFQDSNIVWLKHDGKIDNSFLKVFYSMVKWSGLEGSTIQRLYNKNILDTEISTPERQEQTQIGNYFQKLDSLINQHQQKHDKLSNIKKSMLEKIFPKLGETTPEIRFKGFGGEWENMPFGACFVNVPNNTLSRADLNYKDGMAKNIHYGDVLIKFGEVLDATNELLPFVTNNDVANKLKHAALRDGDIIIADAAEDSMVGKCTELFNIDEQLVLSGLHTIAVRPTLPFAAKYLGYYLNSSSYHDQLLSLMQGTKVLSISKAAIQNTNVGFPKSVEEQAAIGNYFQKLDNLINQHQQKITKLNNIKQACLSKMFV